MITMYYDDAYLFHNIMTELSFTDILYLTNTTPFEWYSKKQATCETATYGSALMAVRMCIEQIMNIRNTLRYLGIPMRWECFKFGDNDSVFNSASIHHTKLHKRHITLSFHRIREASVAGVMIFKFSYQARTTQLIFFLNTGAISKYGTYYNP